MLGAGIFILTLCCGLLVWGTGKYLKTDWTPDFQKLKSTNNGNQLTAEMRDELMDGLSKMQQGQGSSQKFDPKHAEWDIPKGAIMAFNLSFCPEWWSRFTEADGRFIMGSSSKGERGGSSSITLSTDQLPPHRFYLFANESVEDRWYDRKRIKKNWNGYRNCSVTWEHKHEDGDNNYSYTIAVSKQCQQPSVGVTNTQWEWKSINIQNPYIKLLYCQKD